LETYLLDWEIGFSCAQQPKYENWEIGKLKVPNSIAQFLSNELDHK